MRAPFAFLSLLASALASFAEPPSLAIPADLKPTNGYVRFTPTTEAKSVVYIARDDAYPFPSEELKDPRRFILPVVGLKDGTYRFFAVGSLNDEMTVVEFSVVIGKPTTPGPPPVDPPKDPPPAPAGTVYFMVVRPDGPAQAEFASIMADPAWAEHRAAGRRVKDYTLTESTAIYKLPSGTTLPCVVTISSGPKDSKVLAGPVPLPKTTDGIRKLGEGLR